jgi:hypothetical protein
MRRRLSRTAAAATLVGMRFRTAIAAVALAAAAALAPAALSASSHAFTATYRGTGSGQASGTHASGHATAVGRGKLIGNSTLAGSATGVFASASCLTFRGAAVLKGRTGKIKLAASGVKVCPPGPAAVVNFSGRARVTGGTGKFAGASGTVRYHGRYVQQDRSVTIVFNGSITY